MAATGHAKWVGDLESGEAKIDTGSGSVTGTVTAASRFADGEGTNPEELIGAAHAACFSMALTLVLGEAGHDSESIETEASVYLRRSEDGFEINKIELDTVGTVPGISDEDFQKYAGMAKDGCPVSKALAGSEITLEAKLAS